MSRNKRLFRTIEIHFLIENETDKVDVEVSHNFTDADSLIKSLENILNQLKEKQAPNEHDLELLEQLNNIGK